MLKSKNTARELRRSRMERNQLEAQLGHLASDVDLGQLDPEQFDLKPAPSRNTNEDLRSMAQLRALEVVAY